MKVVSNGWYQLLLWSTMLGLCLIHFTCVGALFSMLRLGLCLFNMLEVYLLFFLGLSRIYIPTQIIPLHPPSGASAESPGPTAAVALEVQAA